jgi:MFS family permease
MAGPRGIGLLRAVLANRNLARLEGVWALTTLARWALAILVALYAYRLHGAGAVGVAALIRMLPAALVTSRLAVLVDRRSRRSVLLVTSTARCPLAVGMSLIVWTDGSLGALLALAAAYAVADALHEPAQAALFPRYARNPTELAAANTIWSMLDNGGFVLGSLLVGGLVAGFGLASAYLACAVAMGVGGVFLAGLRADPPPERVPDAAASDFRAGVHTIVRHPELRLLVGLSTTNLFVQAMVDVLVVIAALALLGLGEQGAGWLNAAWGVGGVNGGFAAALLLVRGRVARGVTAGFALAGLPLVALGFWPHTGFAFGLLVILGVGYGMVESALLTLTQRLVAADLLGRVYGMQGTLGTAAAAIGSLVAAALVHLWGARVALGITGALLPLVAVLVARRLEATAARRTPAPGSYERLRGLELFAPLPVATVESLAVRASTAAFPAGATIISAGDHGDAFYVIDTGRVDVSAPSGELRRTEGPGEYFGEIALVRDTVRTATVVAASAVQLFVLGRDEFRAAVGSHPVSRRGVETTVAARLAADETGG